ncbi:hypothetical protein [Yellowstone lake phycodnavirus 2]|uniref:hypothetical protein n=1 Tax=Yellowstone lake phycodnavirus 2 TaxID=1586714 RepID=UPI0006EBB8A1|nr:hypothetical protein AR678_gp124 [Yellowstone lake phycodnavirus 2]BAT22398.1 hypothetical protein [Yellowstone lake phycodnavirus 2]
MPCTLPTSSRVLLQRSPRSKSRLLTQSSRQCTESVRCVMYVVIHRRVSADSECARLSKRVLIRAQVYKSPAITGLLLHHLLDSRLVKLVRTILLTIREDDHDRWIVQRIALHSLTDRIQEVRRTTWLERLARQGWNLGEWLVGVRNKNFVVKLPKSHQCVWVESTLITHECIETTDRVVTALIHRAGTVKQEENRRRHL